VLDLGEGPNHGNDVGLNIVNSNARAALLSLSDDPRATRIDLIDDRMEAAADRRRALPAPVPYGDRSHRAIHQERRRGISEAEGGRRDLVSEPVVIRFGNKAGAKFFCFKDPDGTFLGLIEPYNG
jgi:hypothetical protein